MDDEESNKALLLSHPNPNSNDSKKSLGEKGMYMDWLGRPADDRADLGGWNRALWITVAFGLFYSSFFGIVSNLVIYLVQIWGETSAHAANSVTNLSGTAFVCSFLGAFTSDAYLGRLWTAIVFQILCLLSITASVVAVCWSATESVSRAKLLIAISLYMTAVTSGSVMPNLSSIGADQLGSERDKAKYFTLVAMAISAGQVVGTTVVTYVDSEMGRWGLGFGLCALESGLGLLLSLVVFPRCRQCRPAGNPFIRIVQVLVASVRKRSLSLRRDPTLDLHEVPGQDNLSAIPGCRKLPHTNSLSFLDKAALTTSEEPREKFNPWKLCTVTQVEELKCLLRVIPVGIASTCTAAMAAQMNTLFQVQAAAMNMQVTQWLTIPAASIHLFSISGSILTGFVYNAGGARLLGWFLNPSKKGFVHQATSLQIQGTSIFVGILVMIISALVEAYRLRAAEEGHTLSVLWLVPQTFLVGVSTNFVYAGSMDFFYTEVSDGMRTVSSAVSLLFLGGGNYLSSIFVAIVNDITTRDGSAGWIPSDLNSGHVDYFYWLLASFLTLVLGLFLVYSHFYIYREPPKEQLLESSNALLH